MHETVPQYRTIAFGNDRPVAVGATPTPADWLDDKFVRVGIPFPTPLVGFVENVSDEVELTLALHESSDDAAADAFAAVNLRVNGADVASVVIPPRGKLAFTVEAIAEKYLRWRATPSVMSMPHATLTMVSWLGAIEIYAPAFDTANYPLS